MRARWLIPTAALSIGVGFGLGRWSEPARAPLTPPKMHEYCTAVSVALAMDGGEFEHGTEKSKLAAAQRFGEQVTFHSEHEILLCAKRPVNLEKRALCAIGPDYECLAKIAHDAAEATKP